MNSAIAAKLLLAAALMVLAQPSAQAGEVLSEVELAQRKLDLTRCDYIMRYGTSAQFRECMRIYEQRYGKPKSADEMLREMRER